MYFPIGRLAQFCSVLFEVYLRDLGGVNRRLAYGVVQREMYYQNINVICELLALKQGDLELDLFSNSILMLLLY